MKTTSTISKDMRGNIFLLSSLVLVLLIILSSVQFVAAGNTCGDTRIVPPVVASGIKFTSLSQSVDSQSRNSFDVKIENLDSVSKTFTIQKYACRCMQHLGAPTNNICGGFWPFNPTSFNINVCESVSEKIILGPKEVIYRQLVVSQFEDKLCGSFQQDIVLTTVNDVNLPFQIVAASFADLCNDCKPVECFKNSDCGEDRFVTSSDLVNVASKKPTFENTPVPGLNKDRMPSSNAVDRNDGTWWATGSLNPASLTIDLLSEYEIDKYSIRCGGINNGNAGTIHFFNGDGIEVETKNYVCPGEKNSGKYVSVVSDNFNPGIMVKKVRIDAHSPPGGDWININEIELFSHIETPSPDIFCQDNDVFQNFITYRCNAPGTSSSSCSSTISQNLKQTCSNDETCAEGLCIPSDKCEIKKIWQLGKFDFDHTDLSNNEFPSNDLYFESFDYNIIDGGTAEPDMPGYLTFGKMSQVVGDGRKPTEGAKSLNLFFDLEKNYKNVQLVFSRYGSENNIVKLDDEVVDVNNGQESVNNVNIIALNKLKSGDQSISLTYGYGGVNNGDYIDAVALFGCVDKQKCYQDSDCDDNDPTTEDRCINPGTEDSRCEHKAMHCIKDSDCGFDRFIDGLSCKDGDVFGKFITYKCNNPGIWNSYCSKSIIPKLKEKCEENQDCSDGKCIPKDRKCSKDSDCSSDEFCESEDGKCCNFGTCEKKPEVCPTVYIPVCGCDGKTYSNDCFRAAAGVSKLHDGKCSEIICEKDADCDDYDSSTEDKCINPGTPESRCEHKVIHCKSNVDCGSNGFVGELFCKNGDVFGNYITYTCNNLGKWNSYCSNSTAEKLKTECSSDEKCSNGKCEEEDDDGGGGFEEKRYYDSVRYEDYLVNTNKETAIAFIALNETNKSATISGINKLKKGFNFSLWWIILIIGIMILLLIILIILVIKSARNNSRKR